MPSPKEPRPSSPETHVETAIVADPHHSYADGVYCDSGLLTRFRKAFPGEDKTLLDAFKKEIKDYYERRFPDRLLGTVFFRNDEEYENPTNIKVKKVVLGKPKFRDPRRGEINMPWALHVSFDTVKKAPENQTPFTDMSDRELDRWLLQWEHDAPENFWMANSG